jgi:hypothetical protein
VAFWLDLKPKTVNVGKEKDIGKVKGKSKGKGKCKFRPRRSYEGPEGE